MANAPNYRRTEDRGLAVFAGTLREERAINERLAKASDYFILISPSTTCVLPPGCTVSFNEVKIDPLRESYPMRKDDDNPNGERGLYGTAIFKLANAAGVGWNGKHSYRVDDGTDPLYCHWHVEGARRALDGSIEPLDDDCQIDLREGSNLCRKLWEEAKTDEKAYTRLRDMRSKVLERAVTGAKLRALRKAFGLGKFTLRELQTKPFLVTRLVYDGYDSDPEIFRDNKRAIRDLMLGGMRAAFGAEAVENFEATRAKRLVRTVPPPPVGSVLDAPEIEDDFPPEWGSSAGEPASQAAPPPPPRTEARAPAPPPPAARSPYAEAGTHGAGTHGAGTHGAAPPPSHASPDRGGRPAPAPATGSSGGRSGLTMPGRKRGIAIEDASDEDLNYWANRLDTDLRNGTSRYPDKDRRIQSAILAELDRRLGEAPF